MEKILVEVRPPGATGDLGTPLTETFLSRVDDLGQSLKEITAQLSKHLDNLEKKETEVGWQLESVELKFSLDLEAEAGVIIAKTKTSAGFEASLSWKFI
jgi:hypothetical protein